MSVEKNSHVPGRSRSLSSPLSCHAKRMPISFMAPFPRRFERIRASHGSWIVGWMDIYIYIYIYILHTYTVHIYILHIYIYTYIHQLDIRVLTFGRRKLFKEKGLDLKWGSHHHTRMLQVFCHARGASFRAGYVNNTLW